MSTLTGIIYVSTTGRDFDSIGKEEKPAETTSLDYRAQMVVAYRHYLDKNYTLALNTYRRVLADYPADVTALSGEAWSLYYLGDKERAAADFRALRTRTQPTLGPSRDSPCASSRRTNERHAHCPREPLLNERGIAFDPNSGEIYQLVGPAVHLVKLLQKGADDDALLQFLLEEYKVDEATARRDLAAFLRSLEQMKLWAIQKT